jgi:hypothetical protein
VHACTILLHSLDGFAFMCELNSNASMLCF